MKNTLFAFIFLSSALLHAQSPYMGINPDTIYYHFYNGVQMIEIRTESLHRSTHSDLTRDNLDRKLSIYLFRNQSGNVIQQYNTYGIEVIFSSLKSPDQVKDQLKHHRERDADLTPKTHRYAFPGRIGWYKVVSRSAQDDEVFGVIDSLGKVVLPMEYKALMPADSAFIFVKDGRYGLMDLQLNITMHAEFDMIKRVHTTTPYYNVQSGGKWGMMDRKGKIVLPCDYEEVYASTYDKGYFGVQQNGKWGLVDKQGRLVLPCKYDIPLMFFTNSYCKARSNGLFGFIDSTVTEICPTVYSSIEVSRTDIRGKRGDEYIFMNRKGKILCRSRYEITAQLAPNRFIVNHDGKFGIIDSTNRTMEPLQHDRIVRIEENLAHVALNGMTEEGYLEDARYVLMNADGQRLSKKYRDMEQLNGGLFKVRKGERYGIINRKGDVVVPVEYDYVSNWYNGLYLHKDKKYFITPALDQPFVLSDEQHPYLHNGRARIKQGKHYGYVDSTGKLMIPVKYEYGTNFHQGISAVRSKGKHIIIDRYGRQVIKDYFDTATQWSNGMIIVTKDKKKYLVNGLSRSLVPMPYETVDAIYDNKVLLKVSKEGKQGVVNVSGEVIVPTEYYQVSESRGMLFVMTPEKKMGYYDFKGNVLMPAIYESVVPITDYTHKFFWARLNGKWGVINDQKQVIYPFIFDNMPHFWHYGYLQFAEAYLAELSLSRRHTIELWYINTNATLVGKRTVENTQKGFKAVHNNKGAYSKYGLINWDGDTIVPFRYQQIHRLEEDHFVVVDDRKLGWMDTTGKLIVPCLYDEVVPFRRKNLVKARLKNKWALYNTKGEKLFEAEYNGFGEMNGGELIGFGQGGTFIPDGYGDHGHYENGRIGILDKEGKILVEPTYDYIWMMDIKEGLMVAKLGGEMCVLDKNGKIRSGLMPSATAAERWGKFTEK